MLKRRRRKRLRAKDQALAAAQESAKARGSARATDRASGQAKAAARRANITGEVVLEIVVRRDGNVGDVKILQRLGSGLDQRAIEAVRQWRFAPARMKGTPVDVIVEVSVEFKLR